MQRPTGKAKMMADVWCLMPLSTIFHLYFGGHTINGGQINALYYSYFSHWIWSINMIFKVKSREVTFEIYLLNILSNHQFTIL
jgi:hypothetical protein